LFNLVCCLICLRALMKLLRKATPCGTNSLSLLLLFTLEIQTLCHHTSTGEKLYVFDAVM
ncbi:hypothetical protein UlMin_043968, partial [Ulmus minor]